MFMIVPHFVYAGFHQWYLFFFFVSGKFMLCAEISLEVSSLPVFGSLSDNTRSSVFRLL